MEPGWQSRHSKSLAVFDGIAVIWAMAGALILRFGSVSEDQIFSNSGNPYVILTLLLAAVWWMMLGLTGSRDSTVMGSGTEEFKRILRATFWLFGFIAVVSYSLQLDIARGYVALALPSGVISLFVSRLVLRGHLRTHRRSGACSSDVLIIGGMAGVEHLAKALGGHPMAGYRPVAAYVPGGNSSMAADAPLKIVGFSHDTEAILSAIRTVSPDAVALSSGVPLPPGTIRELGWALADMRIRMIMAPALTDIAGPRIHTQPIAGLPLIHVSTPNLAKSQQLVKRYFDILGASLMTVALSPVLLAVMLSVKLDSPGPVFFKQKRVGTNGQTFEMYKFRSMVEDAESQREALLTSNEGQGLLFKLKSDPRITRTGHFLRRYSLDELPQLINVLNGSMSLVGPRPPLPSEVAQYQRHVHRRLMVRPGLTGLWQVSGRSLLSWDESVRLDLYYVENWSLLGDITILLKTIRAVLTRHGAY